MCVCKNGYNQTGCRQNNHKDLVIAHKHPPPVKLRSENHSRSTGCLDKYIMFDLYVGPLQFFAVLSEHLNHPNN